MLRLLPLVLLLAPHAFAAADLSVSLHHVGGVPFFGHEATQELRVTNGGPDAATEVVAVWTFETPMPATFDARCAAAENNTLRCSLGTLGAGDSAVLSATKLLTGVSASLQFSRAEVSTTAPDPNAANNEATLLLYPITVLSDLGLNLEMPASIAPDGTATFRYTIKDQSHWPADLSVKIAISDAVELVASNAPCARSSEAGLFAVCDLPTLVPGEIFTLDVTVRFARPDGNITASFTPVWNAIGVPGFTSTHRATYTRRYAVTTAADGGPGSLRDAIVLANEECRRDELPCVIELRIAGPVPENGWFTIRPATPLPAITADHVTVDATTQIATSGDTNPLGPEVELDGSLLASGNGFFLNALDVVVRGFAIGGFPDNGVFHQGHWGGSLGTFKVERSYVGVDPTGMHPAPNGRGVMAPHATSLAISNNVISGNRRSGIFVWNCYSGTVLQNRIGVGAHDDRPIPNGASGIYFGSFTHADATSNVIANNAQFGVAIGLDQEVGLFGNVIENNGLGGVDLGLDGPTPARAPVITAAYFDGTGTVIEGMTPPAVTGPLSWTFSVLLYANDELDADGLAEGEEAIGSANADATGRFSFRYGVDLRGRHVTALGTQWVNAYGIRTYPQTMELSPPKKVE